MKKILSEVSILEPVPIPSGLKSNFGEKRPDEVHPGVDIPVPVGTKVLAPMDGEVVLADFNFNPKCGATIDIDYKNGFWSRFCHMSRIDVKQGDKVEQGQIVGLSGGKVGEPGAGKTTGPHLHFALKKNNNLVDPLKFINKDFIEGDTNSVENGGDGDEVKKIVSKLGTKSPLSFDEYLKNLDTAEVQKLFQKSILGPFAEEVKRIKQLIK
jgi:hypothetical protein